MMAMTTPGFFTVTAEITYYPMRVPKGCRKPRPVKETIIHSVQVPSVTSAEAPVVALVPNDRGHLGSPGGNVAELRAWNGQLYTVESSKRGDVTSPAEVAGVNFPSAITLLNHRTDGREVIESVDADYKQFLIVDGQVWRATDEPVYTVANLGLGHNHGGTFLDIEVRPAGNSLGHRFSLADHAAAVTGALEIAERNGDNKSYDRIKAAPAATILDASAFKVPSAAVRIAAAEDEIRSLAKLIRGRLCSDLTHESLRGIKELVEQADNLLWKHELQSVPTTGKKD